MPRARATSPSTPEAARTAKANGRDVFLVGLVGSASPEIERFDHIWVKIGELGKLKN